VRLTLPVALASAGGSVSLDAGGVTVNGHLEAAEMPLYPAAPFIMSGVFVPNSERRLRLRSARPGFITVAAAPLHRVDTLGRELTAERDCKDIALHPVTLEDAAVDRLIQAPPPTTKLARPWPWLRRGSALLSPLPDADSFVVVEVFEPRDDSLTVHPPRILAREKGKTRVALRTFGGVLFGWIESDRLTTSSEEYLDLSHDAFSILSPPPYVPGHFFECKHDAPFIAEAGGQRRVVGTIVAGTRFERKRSVAGFTEIRLHDSAIVPAAGASFWSREADLADCSPS